MAKLTFQEIKESVNYLGELEVRKLYIFLQKKFSNSNNSKNKLSPLLGKDLANLIKSLDFKPTFKHDKSYKEIYHEELDKKYGS